MRVLVTSDSHSESTDWIEAALDGEIDLPDIDAFADLGDILSKDGNRINETLEHHKGLDRTLVEKETPFFRLPGNYDQVASNDDFLNALNHTSDLRYVDIESAFSEDVDITLEEAPTPHSYALGIDDTLLIFVHAGLAGETPYAPETVEDEVDLNSNLYFEGQLLPDSLEANYSKMTEFAEKSERNYDSVVMIRGHEEISDTWKRFTDRYEMKIYTVGAYMHGRAALLEIGEEISFEEIDVGSSTHL